MGHVRVHTAYGTATVWLDFPGEPVNALDRARLAELDCALTAVATNPSVNIVVLRSARPAGFCAGLAPAADASLTQPADRAAFAAYGQRVADRLADLPQTTVAYLDGPVLGAGLELALACDHRLVLSRITTHLGFAGPTCLGGAARLRRIVGRRGAASLLTTGRTVSGREAVKLGLVDHAFCERRGKIELRTFLDALERRGWRPRRRVEWTGLAAERQAFAAAQPAVVTTPVTRPTLNPLPQLPEVIGLLSDDVEAGRLAAEVVLRGGRVVAPVRAAVDAGIALALTRGFVTPLEAEQARARVIADGFDRAGLVFTDGPIPAVGRRCVVARVGERPVGGLARVVGLRWQSDFAAGGSPPHPACFAAALSPEGRGWEITGPVRSTPHGMCPEVVAGWSPSPLGGEGRGEARGVRGRTTHDADPWPSPFGPGAELLPHADTDPNAAAALAAWLTAIGRAPEIVPAPRPVAARTRRPTTIPA